MSLKILIVDDSRTVRQIVTQAFKAFDCTVLEADNGITGLAAASREKPDLILLDCLMPIMGGIEALARLRFDPDLTATPVVMLTAEPDGETVMKIVQLGAHDYIIKPLNDELLIERVSRVVTLPPKSSPHKKCLSLDDSPKAR